MFKNAGDALRFATVALVALMCLAAAGMLFGLATFGGGAGREVVARFVLVAAFPFMWAGLAGILLAKRLNPVMLFGLTAIVLVAFVGAVDFANGRPPYDWVGSLLS
jgi:peptidoglycan/LPS O-acetylase OafA/YrhL